MADYTVLNQVLHRIVLGSSVIAGPLSIIERKLFPTCTDRRDAVYVTGLARAGSTALLHALYGSGAFASLTYSDMPFVMAPNLWRYVTRFDPTAPLMRERAHKDGLYEDVNSPASLEEVFWRVALGTVYIRENELIAHEVDKETVRQLRGYQSLVCRRYAKNRYLAKNNNMILRLASLAPQTPDTSYLVLFRHPLAHALSLLDQHERFSLSDAFVQDYMTWLVHHEFGATNRPFRFSGSVAPNRAPSTVDYWLERWIDAYSHLTEFCRSAPANVKIIQYERLCEDDAYRSQLFKSLGVSMTDWTFKNKNRYSENVNEAIFARSMRIYEELCVLSSRTSVG